MEGFRIIVNFLFKLIKKLQVEVMVNFKIFLLLVVILAVIVPIIFAEDDPTTGPPELIKQTRGFKKGSKVWPGGKVYWAYFNNTGSDLLKKSLKQAMTSITKATKNCITFEETSPSKNKNNSGVVIILEDGGCGSVIGYAGQKKTQSARITLGDRPRSCHKGSNGAGFAAHELMHVLGFVHEYQRNDRDKYIKIKPEIKEKIIKAVGKQQGEHVYEVNFGVDQDETYGLPFNFKSIMMMKLKNYFDPVPNPKQAPIGNINNTGQFCAISMGDRNLIEQTYAAECRQDKKPLTYKEPFKITGTDCGMKFEMEPDEVDDS